jgi:hypothetical protein
MRTGLLTFVILTLACAALPGVGAADAARSCGTFRATSFTGAAAHIRVKVYTGPVGCGTAREVLRYAITHKEVAGNSAVGSPKGWLCANGGPGIFPAAAGYSCEAVRPRRIVTGLFLQK